MLAFSPCHTADARSEMRFCMNFSSDTTIYKPTASLSDACGIQLGVKNYLLACLEELDQQKSKAPPASCIVLNGSVIAQVLKPAIVKSFNEYAHQVFCALYTVKASISDATQSGVEPLQ